ARPRRVGDDQVHMEQAWELEVGCESGRSRDLFTAFLPPPTPDGYAHQPQMLRTKGWRPLAALICLVFVSCSNGSGGTTPPASLATDQTLRSPIQHEVSTLDPAMIDSQAEAEIAQNLFDGLLKFDGNLNVVPAVALSMPAISSDGASYTFKLRQDVTFSNGDKVTSKDVLYSWNRAAAMQGAYATNLSAIEGYDKVSKNTASGAALEALLEKNDPSVTLTGLTAPDASTVMVKLANP